MTLTRVTIEFDPVRLGREATVHVLDTIAMWEAMLGVDTDLPPTEEGSDEQG